MKSEIPESMMISKKHGIFLIVFLATFSLFAQKEKSQYFTESRELWQARALKSTDPGAAIKAVEQLLRKKGKRKSPDLEVEAYMLLGEIYEEMNQPDGALKRYKQAEQMLRKMKVTSLKTRNYTALGNLYLSLGNEKEAYRNFSNCLNLRFNDSYLVQCKIGMADLDFANKDYDSSLEKYDAILNNKSALPDSLTRAKIEAKKAQVFVAQSKLEAAKNAFNVARNAFPNVLQNQEKDYNVIEEVTDSILEKTESLDEKIALRQSNLNYKQSRNFSNDAIISEQLKLADLFLEKGDVNEAENYISVSKSLAEKDVAPEQQARVFKKSSEISSRKGALKEAVEDLSSYASASEKSIEKKKGEVEEKLKVLKNQSNIDILGKDVELEEKQALLLQNQIKTQRLIIGFLSLLLLAALVSFYFIMKNVKAKRKANTLLLLKSLRTQMNPHFIFNALNSVNNFIAQNDERAANKFLSRFSRLMRMVLDYSQKDFIPFDDEIHLIELYLELEHSRFRDKFDYSIEKNTEDDFGNLEIPPMLIQPFIENAVWHGLRYKTGKGHLKLSVKKEKNDVEIVIEDDGIGREKSKAIKTKNQKKYKSTGMKNVEKRVALLNEIYGKNYRVEIADLRENEAEPGTRISIKL